METNDNILKQLKKQQKQDRSRIFRVVEYLDYCAIFEHCPVEIIDGYIISDVDNYEIFASFVFRNVSKKKIESLDIRLICYQNQNIPYIKIPFTYSFKSFTLGNREINGKRIRDKKQIQNPYIAPSESFGETVYIPIPETYFSKFELEISGVKYADGNYEKLEVIAGKRVTKYKDLTDESKFIYSKLNIFSAAEELFPTRFVPQKGEYAWLCCCGQKNLNELDKCENCLRDRDWQFENLEVNKLENAAKEIAEEEKAYFKNEKTSYSQLKFLQTDEDIQRKVKAYELAMKKVAEDERRRMSRRMWLLPRIFLCFVIIYLISQLIIFIYSRLRG
ncbi:MAG: hypothetical protein A2Y15_06970 [Clostridiales bacterium GWF2_36_10]|nr:MAG: hypothetical protein A2Y15_06970 [Clostridiales bacterium GWF2_36_10]HAN21372.1 hypothetical protein [Clostridiales bacterium]